MYRVMASESNTQFGGVKGKDADWRDRIQKKKKRE